MKLKRIISVLLLALMLSAVAFSTPAATAANTLSAGSFVNITKNGYYKISVSGEGYVVATLRAKGSKTSSFASAYLDFLNAKKKDYADYSLNNDVYAYIWGKGNEDAKTDKMPVSKGTYYIKISDRSVSDGGSIQVKYTFTSVKQGTNYTCSKAETLKKGTAKAVYQTPANNFDRWYKISLTSNAKIKFSGTNLSTLYFDVYDADGNEVRMDNMTTAKLAKGTYYVRLSTDSKAYGSASFCTIMWK